jgi:hypothetical protein
MRESENHELLAMDQKPRFVEEHTIRIMYTCMVERRKEKEISGNQGWIIVYHNIKKFQ